MPDSTRRVPRRRDVRLSGAVVAAAFAAGVLTLPTATAEEQDSNLSWDQFAPDQFEGDVVDLPAGMAQAVEQDLGISAAQYLANAHAARDYAGLLADLRDDGVSVSAPVFDSSDQTLSVRVTDESDVSTVEAIDGVRVLDEKPDGPSIPDEFASPGGSDADHTGDAGAHPSAIMSAEATEPIVGMQVCGAAGDAGFRCGEVLAVDTEVQVNGNPVRGFVTDVCAAGDELGESVRSGASPVGTAVARAESGSDDCADREPGSGGIFGVVTGEDDIFGENDQDTPTEDGTSSDEPTSDGETPETVPAPVVERPVDGDVTDAAVQFDGAVSEFDTGDRVVISIDGDEAVETSAEADGSFSVSLPDPLHAGTEHTYEVRTIRGDDRSEPVSGRFTVVQDEPEIPPIIPISVLIPVNGQEFLDPRPEFAGSGQGVSDIDVTIDGETFGETGSRVDSGYWSMISESLPVGVRFDAVFTQTWDSGPDEVYTDSETVSDLGVRAPRVAVTSPEHGSAVESDVVFEGTSFPGADVEVRVEGDGADDGDAWPGELDVDEDGTWTFVPDEQLPDGEYTVIAEATLDGGDAELSDSTSGTWFRVSDSG